MIPTTLGSQLLLFNDYVDSAEFTLLIVGKDGPIARRRSSTALQTLLRLSTFNIFTIELDLDLNLEDLECERAREP